MTNVDKTPTILHALGDIIGFSKILILSLVVLSCSPRSVFAVEKVIYSKEIVANRTFINWDSLETKTQLETGGDSSQGRGSRVILHVRVLETALAQDFGKDEIFSDSEPIAGFEIADSGNLLFNFGDFGKILCGRVKVGHPGKIRMDSSKCSLITDVIWKGKLTTNGDTQKIPFLQISIIAGMRN